ncbi:HD domain-containing protein [Synechococcus sp. HK01-R]|jgi:HD superfamily phosphohydrolase|uniref:HD domain-containing protein n=1 Tax=Synechococcus sp. HK01-R TaxID=2751171 RepID=UPI001629C0E8|nr:HD domain-containing protein [Synechococcus sp. HK01-R]QNG27169.1 HD domain-containing protein [Synechococcus sp. HK01-R]
MSSRTFHDPLHRSIRLDASRPAEAMVMALVDSQPFQRLRRIRQLGPAFLTFHGAESSRFTHSLGVFHLARQALDRLVSKDPTLECHRGTLYAAALLHDLGHGPLSHTGEEMFGLHHEQWSARLVREHPQIRPLLDAHSAGTADAVANLLGHDKAERSVIKALVSSQLDCDRLDYLLRDSYSTGTRYGQLDLERILSALTLAPDGELAIHPKGLMAVEHYLVVRNLMYRSVYSHRLNVVCNWLLEQVIRIARQLGPGDVWCDAVLKRWLWSPKQLDLNAFLANDDLRTGYHLLRWAEDGPAPLANLCQRFLDRQLLKASAVEHLSSEQQLEALALARRLSEQQGMDAETCCGLRHQQLRGYHPYRGGLRLWDGQRLLALEQESPLVQSLTTPAASAWLIHPREIETELRSHLGTHGFGA